MDVIKDSFILNIGTFIYFGVQWLISVLLVRLGGFQDAGIFSLAMSISNIFTMIANYGLRSFQVSDIKEKYKDETYIFARLITTVLALFLCIGYLLFCDYSLTVFLTVLSYMCFKCIEAYSDVLTGVWQKKDAMTKVGITLTAKGAANLACFFGCYCLTKDLALSVFFMMLGSLAILIFYDNRTTYKFVENKHYYKNADMSQVASLLKVGFLTMLYVLSTTLFSSLPKIIVEAKLDAAQLGVFSSISSPTVIITTFATCVLLPLVPKMAEAYSERNKKNILKYVFGCNAVFVLLGILGTAALMIIGRWVFTFLFGEEILSSFTLVYYVVWVSVLMALLCCYYTFFVSIRKIPIMLAFSFSSILLLAVLCLPFVKTHGIYGAAYAMLSALAIQFILETAAVLFVILQKKKATINA